MKILQKILSAAALLVAGALVSSCDGEIKLPCKGDIHINIVGPDQIEVGETQVAPEGLSAELKVLSEACGGGLIVVVGSEDRAYRETVVKVFNILDDDPSIAGVGIATEKFLAKKAGKKI